MAKNNPILDGFLAGTAVSSVSGKGNRDKGSNAFFIGALAAYRSARQNEEYDRSDRALRRHQSALESQSREVNSRLAELEARQIQAQEAHEQQRRYVASIRQYIVAAEQWLQSGNAKSVDTWEFARFCLFDKVIQRGMTAFDIRLDEQRAIGSISTKLSKLASAAPTNPARMIACTVGLARSIAIWSVLATRPGREILPFELRSTATQYALRLRRAQRLGLLEATAEKAGICLTTPVMSFVNECSGIYPELDILQSVSGTGVAPFATELVQHLHDEIIRSQSEPPPSITVNHPALTKKGGYIFGTAVDPGDPVKKGDLVALVKSNDAAYSAVDIEVIAPENGHIDDVYHWDGGDIENGATIAIYVSVNYAPTDRQQSQCKDDSGSEEEQRSAAGWSNEQVSGSRILGALAKILYACFFLVVGGMLTMGFSWLPDAVTMVMLIVGVSGLLILAPICGVWGLIAWFAKQRRLSTSSAN